MTRCPDLAEVIYIAAAAHDSRFTRICVASVRHFYPTAPIKILPGGKLEPRLMAELRRYWNVDICDIPPGDYGWGYVKLEPLFGPAGERFLVLDSDTVMAGPVLDIWMRGSSPFLVDAEAQSSADIRQLYYDWERLRRIDEDAGPPDFVFNSGQWFGTAGVLTRQDFEPWLVWSLPPVLRHPDAFMPGDQGVLNYVLNRRARDGLKVERRKIMRWPAYGIEDISAANVAKREAPAVIVHWAGLKKARISKMLGPDVLLFFERDYYSRIPGGEARRRVAAAHYVSAAWARQLKTWLRLSFGRLSTNGA